MNANFEVIGLTRLGIKPESTAQETDAPHHSAVSFDLCYLHGMQMEILYLLHIFCLLYFFAFLYFQYEKTDQDAITSSVRNKIAICVPPVYHITDGGIS